MQQYLIDGRSEGRGMYPKAEYHKRHCVQLEEGGITVETLPVSWLELSSTPSHRLSHKQCFLLLVMHSGGDMWWRDAQLHSILQIETSQTIFPSTKKFCKASLAAGNRALGVISMDITTCILSFWDSVFYFANKFLSIYLPTYPSNCHLSIYPYWRLNIGTFCH